MTTTRVALPDENRLDLPASWRTAEPGHAYRDPDPDAPQRLRKLLEEHREGIEELLLVPRNEPYADAVRSYLDGEPDPRGAAAAAALLGAYPEWDLPPDTVPDAWIVEHGLPFAVASTVSGGFRTGFDTARSGGGWARTRPTLLSRHRVSLHRESAAFERTAALRAETA